MSDLLARASLNGADSYARASQSAGEGGRRSTAPPRTAAQCVLVLDGQTTQALACVRSLGQHGHTTLVASTTRAPLAAWSRYCVGSHRLAAESRDAFAQLRGWARERGATVVLPLTERSCLLCNADRDAWESSGIVVGCGPESLLLGAFDKARTFELAAGCGVEYPRTVAPRSLDECLDAVSQVGFPCVVKSRFSNAWDGRTFLPDRGAAYVTDEPALLRAAQAGRQGPWWPLIQRFVPGSGRGVFALCDQGRAVAWFAHERLRDVRPTGSGSSLRRSTALEPRLRAPAETLLATMRWHGPAMVEFRDDGVAPPQLIEVNGRFWGSLQLATAAGVDFPSLWLAILTGQPLPPFTGYRNGVTLRWLWGDVKRLLYILAGRPPGYPGAFPTFGQGLREVLGRQPTNTRIETWDAHDPWPALGEWVQGVRELLSRPHRSETADVANR